MSTEGLPDELRVLGLGAEAVAVYVCLLESGPLAPEDLAARLDCPAPAVGGGAEELRHAGLVAKRAGPAGEVGYAPDCPRGNSPAGFPALSQASLARPGFVTENIRPCVLAGEQARLLPEVSVKLTVVDRRVALVSLAIGETDNNSSLLVVCIRAVSSPRSRGCSRPPGAPRGRWTRPAPRPR